MRGVRKDFWFDGVDISLRSSHNGSIRYDFQHGLSNDGDLGSNLTSLCDALKALSAERLADFLYAKTLSELELDKLCHTYVESKLKGVSGAGYDRYTLPSGEEEQFGSVLQYGQTEVMYGLFRSAYLGRFSAKSFRAELDEVLRRGEEGLKARIYIGAREFAEAWLAEAR
jgi:hypothetical protein